MKVDLLGLGRLVQFLEFGLDVFGGLLVRVLARVLGKTESQRRFVYFLLKKVFFIEEQHDGRLSEPFIV